MKNTVRNHYNQARKLALQEVYKRARTVLRNQPHLDEFIMAMGSWFFTVKEKNWHVNQYDSYKYLEPLKNIIGEWDSELKLTGEGVRFTATGKPKYNW